MTNEILDYKLEGIGDNIKCVVLSCGEEVFRFNCKTKYEDRARETIKEVMQDFFLNGGSLIDACKRQRCEVYLNES